MRLEVLLPLAVLFIAQGVPTYAQSNAVEAKEVNVVVEEGAPLTVECALRVDEHAEWRLDEATPPADMVVAAEAPAATGGARLTARLHAHAARASHAGLYTCASPPTQRVRVSVRRALPGEGAVAANTAAPAAVPSVALPALELLYYDVGRPLTLNCTAPRTDTSVPYVWRKNGTVVSEAWDLSGRFKQEGASLHTVGRAQEDDFGNYTCAATEGALAQGWEVRGRPLAKLPLNTNAVEGQKVKLVCKLIGKPYPAVTWKFSNETDGSNATDAVAALGGRARVQTGEQGAVGAELVLEEARREDAGEFTCVPEGGAPATTRLRVKGMYAALWPFLGICAEVFVLCAIILVYEKRRTKPELDDSDTDNHDQKKS